MIVEHAGIVRKVYKHPTDLWCVEITRYKTGTKGKTIYIGLKKKPQIRAGQFVSKGTEL